MTRKDLGKLMGNFPHQFFQIFYRLLQRSDYTEKNVGDKAEVLNTMKAEDA